MKKIISLIFAVVVVLFWVNAVFAQDEGASKFVENSQRAPHYQFGPDAYDKNDWPIIMRQMATIGPMSYSDAKKIAEFMSLIALESKSRNFLSDHFMITGFGDLKYSVKNHESDTELSYSQYILGLFGERLLLQLEPEISVEPREGNTELELEQGNLTYFVGDHIYLTAGKIMNDFNISQVRLHPAWINLSQDLPWAANFAPASTIGGKLGWNLPVGKVLLGGTLFSGDSSEQRYLEASKLQGARVGLYIPAKTLEVGVSAVDDYETKHLTVGGYLVKRVGAAKLQGEVASNSDKGVAYWGEISKPLQAMPRLTLVARWQQFFSANAIVREEEADHEEEGEHEEGEETDHEDGGMMALHGEEEEMGDEETETDHEEEAVHSEEGGHHGTLPEMDSAELYLGINYNFFESKGDLVQLKVGYAVGFGEEPDKVLGGLTFRW